MESDLSRSSVRKRLVFGARVEKITFQPDALDKKLSVQREINTHDIGLIERTKYRSVGFSRAALLNDFSVSKRRQWQKQFMRNWQTRAIYTVVQTTYKRHIASLHDAPRRVCTSFVFNVFTFVHYSYLPVLNFVTNYHFQGNTDKKRDGKYHVRFVWEDNNARLGRNAVFVCGPHCIALFPPLSHSVLFYIRKKHICQ